MSYENVLSVQKKNEMAVYILFLITVICNSCLIIYAIEDYCSTNKFINDGNTMGFTKEPSTSEYAILGKFKGLHCCAKGYRSIEWYKDGRPYPWHGTFSPLIIYPESANQTVYTQSVTREDAGNYTCLLRNDSVVYTHTITLRVFETLPDDPKITYISENTSVSIGEPLRLFCEAFVGFVDLPDAYSEAFWTKFDGNETFEDGSRIHQVKVSREDGQICGAYLTFNNLKEEDYGKYTCTIIKPGRLMELFTYVTERKSNVTYVPPNEVPYKKLFIAAAITVLLIGTIVILYLQFGLVVRVFCKDHFGRLLENDDKSKDILVLYSEKDAELTLGVLLPTLEQKYNYICGSKQFPNNVTNWHNDLVEACQKSHRIVAVMSPACVNDKWECITLHQALKQLHELDTQFCCIILKQFPTTGSNIKNSMGESFSSLVRNINIINWERFKDDKFWLSVRLKLPPKRCELNVDNGYNKSSQRLNQKLGESISIPV